MCPMIPLGEWLPDQPEVRSGALEDAKNVIPREAGYDSLPGLFDAALGTLNATCQGAMSGRGRGGTNFTVAGSNNRLYLNTTGTLANVSDGGGSPYTTAATDWWDFCLFGNRIISTNYADTPEGFLLGVASNFSDLSADVSRARHCAVVRDFVVLGNLVGRGVNAATIGTAEDAVHWSGIDDPTSWPQVGTNAAKGVQSDWQPLSGAGGEITDLVGGSDFGLIFRRRAIWRMDYEGGDTFFRFTPIDENVGAFPNSTIRVGGVVYFLSEDGVRATNGAETVPIGNGKVDRWFLNEIQDSTEHKISTLYVPQWKCVLWSFMGSTAVSNPNTLLLFNIEDQRFAYGVVSHERLVDVMPYGTSLDSLGTSLDAVSTSLDLQVSSANRTAAVFTTSHGISTFTGTPGFAVIKTAEFEPAPNLVGTLRSIRPVGDSVAMFVTAYSRMRSTDGVTASSAEVEDETGKASFRVTGRYISAKFSIVGEFDTFHSFDADVVQRGAR